MKNKNGIDYYTQSDLRWKNEVMTHPKWQERPDIINDYFCLNTSLLNWYNDYFNENITPKDLNDQLRNNNGYEYLYYKDLYKGNMTEVKKACYNRESYVRWDVIQKLLKIKQIVRNYSGNPNISIPNEYYIIKVPYKSTGHYCDLISNRLDYFDVFDSQIKKPVIYLEILQIVF
jgi:hypothetical protein